MSATEGTPRIVRKRSRHGGGGGHHGGSWKIAYADFITAMMAFFLVMWLINLVPKDQLTGLAEYFRMPLENALQKGVQNNNSQTLIQGGSADIRATPGEIRKGSTPPSPNTSSSTDRRDNQRLESFRRRLDEIIEQSPRLKSYRPQLRIDITSEGLRIQIIDTKNRPMFASGSAQVEPYMQSILRELGPILNEVPNRISLSGHTDARPYISGERSYSNWELSADRANASRRELVTGGMSEDKVMRVTGMASSMPLQRDDVNADINRRISLVLLNRSTERRIEEENAAASTASPHAEAGSIQQAIQEQAAQGQAIPGQAAAPISIPKGDAP